MNRLLYNPILTAKYFLNLEELLILNYLSDNKSTNYHDLMGYIETITGEDGDDSFAKLVKIDWITSDVNEIKLTPKGKAFFQEDTILTPEEYEMILPVLEAWNTIPEVTTHKIASQDKPQTKTVYKSAQIIASVCRGKLHPLIVGCKYHNELVSLTEPILLKDIVDTVKDYGLKFKKEYYPNIKTNLPITILDFFIHHKTLNSEFFTTFDDGVMKKKTGTSTQLEEWGVTVKTLKKVYDVMLTPSDRNSESAKYILMKQLVLLRSQWEKLIEELDKYYLWNKHYRSLTRVFNYFIFDYVDWIGNNISGEKHPMYLQIKEDGHEIYSQFKAWYYDKYTIKFKVGVSQREYLLKKNKKYLEGMK